MLSEKMMPFVSQPYSINFLGLKVAVENEADFPAELSHSLVNTLLNSLRHNATKLNCTSYDVLAAIVHRAIKYKAEWKLKVQHFDVNVPTCFNQNSVRAYPAGSADTLTLFVQGNATSLATLCTLTLSGYPVLGEDTENAEFLKWFLRPELALKDGALPQATAICIPHQVTKVRRRLHRTERKLEALRVYTAQHLFENRDRAVELCSLIADAGPVEYSDLVSILARFWETYVPRKVAICEQTVLRELLYQSCIVLSLITEDSGMFGLGEYGSILVKH